MLGTQRRFFGNIVGHAKGVSDPVARVLDGGAVRPQLDWEKIERTAQPVGRPVILKGILDRGCEDGREDRRRRDRGLEPRRAAARRGAVVDPDAALDRGRGGRPIEVHLDGGIRSGQDVLKALALGAKGTYDRAGLRLRAGRDGQAGVTKALEVIHKELDTTMALCGERDVAMNLGRHNLILPRTTGSAA
jgi:L-lactate dehydrogenase (cytochrome)